MTFAKVISILYKYEDGFTYVDVLLQRCKPMDDKFTMQFYSPKTIDNVSMLYARLQGMNIRVGNKAEFESIYKTAKTEFLKSGFKTNQKKDVSTSCQCVHENVLSSF